MTADEVLARLPAAESLGAGTDREFDVAILPLGFEDRCPVVAESLADLGAKVGSVVVPIYPSNREDNRKQWPRLERAIGVLSQRAPQETDVGIALFEALEAQLARGSWETRPRVLFDISAASNALLMDTLALLLEHDCYLVMTYTAALSYYPVERDVLTPTGKLRKKPATPEPSVGTGSLDIDVRHPGRFPDVGSDTVVVIPGFDSDRSRKVLTFVDPTLLSRDAARIYWLLGEPLREEDQWRNAFQQLLHQANGCGSAPENVRSASTFDYKQIVRVLEEIYSESSAPTRLTVSPMGSKMQAVGCSIFCYARPEVRIIFASPVEYMPAYYSEGAAESWLLDFGDTAILRQELGSIGSLYVEDSEGSIVFSGHRRIWPERA